MKPPPPRLPIVLMEPKDVKPATLAKNPIQAGDTGQYLFVCIKLCLFKVFICPNVSYQDRMVRSRHQMEEIQNLQKTCHLFCRDLPDRGDDGCCQRMDRHQNGQHLKTGA